VSPLLEINWQDVFYCIFLTGGVYTPYSPCMSTPLTITICLMLTVTDDELEMVGVLGPKCTKIYFDHDNILKKQVVQYARYFITWATEVLIISYGWIFS